MAAQLFFDSVAELYERARPGYPELLVDDLIRLAEVPNSGDILDIGCGTGKSTEPFVKRLFKITALDPGGKMLGICRKKFAGYPDISYVQSDFESYDADYERFDLAISGTAFHWVSGESQRKVMTLLKPQGSVAIFWHTYLAPRDEMARIIGSVYEAHAPELYSPDISAAQELGDMNKERSLLLWPGFRDWRIIRYYEDRSYSSPEYADLLNTYSTHAALGLDFFPAIQEAIESSGGKITLPIRTTLCCGKRDNRQLPHYRGFPG
jgi:SAM-dependent methyltransferase